MYKIEEQYEHSATFTCGVDGNEQMRKGFKIKHNKRNIYTKKVAGTETDQHHRRREHNLKDLLTSQALASLYVVRQYIASSIGK